MRINLGGDARALDEGLQPVTFLAFWVVSGLYETMSTTYDTQLQPVVTLQPHTVICPTTEVQHLAIGAEKYRKFM